MNERFSSRLITGRRALLHTEDISPRRRYMPYMVDQLIVVLCTAPSVAVAEDLATRLVSARLAACVNLVHNVTSFYVWKGEAQRDVEIQLVIKTRRSRFEELATWLSENHPYDEPEIIALPVAAVSEGYGAWVLSGTVTEG